MKIVIDIPEEIIEHAKNKSEDSNDEYVAMRAIANGTPIEVVDKFAKFEDASCENCEHAYRGADPLKILQESGNVFCCSAGFKYGGADTVCSEWKRKEGGTNEACD